MRPPLNAGENRTRTRGRPRRGGPFNEAPAERGGKPTATVQMLGKAERPFNEAPAERGGKPGTGQSGTGTLERLQ